MVYGSWGLAMRNHSLPKVARNAARRRRRREAPPAAEGGAERRPPVPRRLRRRLTEVRANRYAERQNTMRQNTTLTGFIGAPAPVSVDVIFEKCALLGKSADPRFLHTVQRFGLISKVLGLPKHGKNSKKTVLEIFVFRGSKKVLPNLFFLVFF